MAILITVILFVSSVEINRRLIPALIRWTGGPDYRPLTEIVEVQDSRGAWPFVKGERAEVAPTPERWKAYDHLVWLKWHNGQAYPVDRKALRRGTYD